MKSSTRFLYQLAAMAAASIQPRSYSAEVPCASTNLTPEKAVTRHDLERLEKAQLKRERKARRKESASCRAA